MKGDDTMGAKDDSEYTRVTVRVKTDRYIEFKKRLLDDRTTPTAAINRYIIEYLEGKRNTEE